MVILPPERQDIGGIYVPAVISIQSQWDVVHAPRHLAEQIRRQRACLSGADLRLVRASVSRNYYMVYPENIILAMLGDETPSVRTEAMELIRDMRQRPCSTNIGSLRKRDLNFQAGHYTDLTNLRAAGAGRIEPHYCRAMDDEQIDAYLVTPLRTGVLNNTQ